MRYIYVYETPKSKKKSSLKIGDSNNPEKRIRDQFNTASAFDSLDGNYEILFISEAVKDDGTGFRDYDIHKILEKKGYPRHKIEGDGKAKSTEYHKIDLDSVKHLINEYKKGKRPEEIDINRYQDFSMRPEQRNAVEQTAKYFQRQHDNYPVEMLWNAKMRFGKTFTAYQLAKKMGLCKVLILTYKPAVEDAWQKDLERHVDFKNYVFLTRSRLENINHHLNSDKGVVAFASYQDILGKKDDEDIIKDKHKELFSAHWDLVIIDEFHYGSSTARAKEVFACEVDTQKELEKINKEFTSEEDEEAEEEKASKDVLKCIDKSIRSQYRLFLSGTPFKAMADSRFPDEAIFNWTYTDEQRAKAEWNLSGDNTQEDNPYRKLPQIKLYLYKVSKDVIEAGQQEGKDEFSLNYFFKTKNKKFINEPAVRKWLDIISGRLVPEIDLSDQIHEKDEHHPSQYPFDSNESLCVELDHTLWYLNRKDSAYALKELLEDHPIFSSYKVIPAFGKEAKSGVDAVQPVLDAINSNGKTITLTVGKLTTGVSIPKWKGVLFLRDMDSPENYFQTAFRAQTPHEDGDYLKKTCFIFDFSPNRSLRLLTSYSEKLSPDSRLTTSQEKINEFIRYLPVLKVSGNRMVSMDAQEVLTFDLSGLDAKGLGERFIERKNIVVTRETIDAINSCEENQHKCQAIFNKIKKYKKFIGASDRDIKKSDAEVANLDANNKKVKNLETKELRNKNEEEKNKKNIDEAEKELKSEREKVRELLITLLSRIPIFMYLTDATEENLEQVLAEDEDDLFRKTAGIQVADFKFLRDMGLIKVDSLDGYIQKFKELESKSFTTYNNPE